jgi:hypothetical protein
MPDALYALCAVPHDLKPSNLLHGADGEVKIADLARSCGSGSTPATSALFLFML